MKSKTNTRSPFKWSATCSFCFVRFQAFKQVLIKF
nr:MAG TPA: DNA primase/helicase [Caudoviricetes sp.]